MLDVKASGNVPTTFTRLLGQEKLDIGSSAQVKWGVKKLELALVLDNTGSMASSGKLTQLKLASHNLLTTLQTAAKQPGDVKVAIIPFDTKVNIGTGYAGQSWMDYSVNHIQQNQWQGCVQDRDQPNDTTDTTPTSDIHTKFPAAQCSGLTTMMTLTDILDTTGFTNLNSKIDAMQAVGQHQRDHRAGVGLARADQERAADPGQRSGARQGQGDRAADRRRQHAEPLELRAARRSTRAPRRPAPTPRRRTSRSTRCG